MPSPGELFAELFPTFTAAQWIILLGTMFTGVGTIITAWAAVVRSKKETRTEEEINCLERLRQSRRDEAESADELYAMRKQRREE